MKIKGHKLKAFGVYAGIGAPLVGAKHHGYKIIGNIDSRPYVNARDIEGRNTFEDNFPGAYLTKTVPDKLPKNVTFIAGHPKCGSYSNLVNITGRAREKLQATKSVEFITTLEVVAKVKPLFFFMDNLPKFLSANHVSLFVDYLKDYDIFPEFVSNMGYGNCQHRRHRLFFIAARKDLGYVFIPGECTIKPTVKDIIGDLFTMDTKYSPIQHDTHLCSDDVGLTLRGKGVYQKETMSWCQFRHYFQTKNNNKAMHYHADDGLIKYHFALDALNWTGGSRALTGNNPKVHPLTGLPLSTRERARIMGFPDSFVIRGIRHEPDGTWSHMKNSRVNWQTGKCIPCEFPAFMAGQIKEFLLDPSGYHKQYSKIRTLKPHPLIVEAKKWCWENVGYSRKKLAKKTDFI
jgi:site-specific DNA-cytosine methylase